MENNETIKNLSRINARIYELMFLLYDQMAQIKEQLDLLIKSGKTYYKGYKITGDIGFDVDEEEKPEIDDYFEAESEWKLVFEYGKKTPTKLKALDLWKNYSKDELSIPMDYICRVTYGFLHPKKEEDEKPYWANYLCFSMHGLYTHCDLTRKEVLKMKLRNFSPYFEIRIERTPEE